LRLSDHADFEYSMLPGLSRRAGAQVCSLLAGDVAQRCKELLRETARAHEIMIHAGAVNRDHVHMLLSTPVGFSRGAAP
jgi:hypothetical protein